ncbi:restriction endonuclease subunit S [Promicromonospora soli]
MTLDVRRTPMVPGTTYRLAGVLNAGQGLIGKGEFDGGDTEYSAMNVLRTDQVVMRKLTAWEGPITVVPSEYEGFVVSNEFPTFTLGTDVAPEWMRHVCRSPRLWAEMKNRVSGTVQRRKRLNPGQLLQIELPIPPREVQERIADVLGAVDDQITALEAEAEAGMAMRRCFVDEYLSRPNSAWKRVTVGEVADVLIGPAFKSSVFKNAREGRRLLRGVNLGPHGTRWADADTVFWPESEHEPYTKYDLIPDDICIAMDRPFTRARVLRCALISDSDLPSLVVQRVTRLRARAEHIVPSILLDVVRSGPMAERLAGRQTDAGYAPHISGSDISTFEFGLPSLPEQADLARMFTSMDATLTATRTEADRLRAVRASLLSALLNGDIEIADCERTAA